MKNVCSECRVTELPRGKAHRAGGLSGAGAGDGDGDDAAQHVATGGGWGLGTGLEEEGSGEAIKRVEKPAFQLGL